MWKATLAFLLCRLAIADYSPIIGAVSNFGVQHLWPNITDIAHHINISDGLSAPNYSLASNVFPWSNITDITHHINISDGLSAPNYSSLALNVFSLARGFGAAVAAGIEPIAGSSENVTAFFMVQKFIAPKQLPGNCKDFPSTWVSEWKTPRVPVEEWIRCEITYESPPTSTGLYNIRVFFDKAVLAWKVTIDNALWELATAGTGTIAQLALHDGEVVLDKLQNKHYHFVVYNGPSPKSDCLIPHTKVAFRQSSTPFRGGSISYNLLSGYPVLDNWWEPCKPYEQKLGFYQALTDAGYEVTLGS